MINLLNVVKSFISLSILLFIAFFTHKSISDFYYVYTPLESIYVFNYLLLIFFLIVSKLNMSYKLVNILTLFISLTFIKMLSTVIFFLYFNSNGPYDMVTIVYNFFPVYFLLLLFEILELKKSLNNI